MLTTCPKCGTDFVAGSLTCMRCGHNWTQRGDAKPLTCAKCKSPYWQKRRIRAKITAPIGAGMKYNLDGTRKKVAK